ncbi:MAG: hypothetical protein K5865_02565, partial [Eubacterium sp.]|nr:hypothetical protein [Eubacterium sp.]
RRSSVLVWCQWILGVEYELSKSSIAGEWSESILCRKKREKADHGKFYFYDSPQNPDTIKHALIEAHGGECVNLNCGLKSDDYIPFYKAAIEDIARRIG